MQITDVLNSLLHDGLAIRRDCWPRGKYVFAATSGVLRTDYDISNKGNVGPMLVRKDPFHDAYMPYTFSQQEIFADDWHAYNLSEIIGLDPSIRSRAAVRNPSVDGYLYDTVIERNNYYGDDEKVLCGHVYGREGFIDGEYIHTSSLRDIGKTELVDGEVVETKYASYMVFKKSFGAYKQYVTGNRYQSIPEPDNSASGVNVGFLNDQGDEE